MIYLAFQSFSYFIFLIGILAAYYLVPIRFRWGLLLAGSYFFYMCWNACYALLLMLTTVTTFISGALISRANQITDEKRRVRQKKGWALACITLNIAILFCFKYGNMFFSFLGVITDVLGLFATWPKGEWLIPVGISFYTFQALGYMIDVYRGKVTAARHFGKYALFVSFFPQLVAGPIARSSALLKQFDEIHRPDFEIMRKGALMILTGLVKKLLIADRLAVLVNLVYENVGEYSAPAYAVATVCFAFQIYCDFSGYSDIAIGSAKLLGFRLVRNFDRPYFAASIQDFWKRWHITLGTWFRDYVFIPLSGFLIKRKWGFRPVYLLASLVVWLLTGLWHGSSLGFILWGFLHGLYLAVGFLTARVRSSLYNKLRFRTETFPFRLCAMLLTFMLTCFSWIFFRANTPADLQLLLTGLITHWDFSSLAKLVYLVNGRECLLIAALALGLFIVECLAPKHGWQEWLFARPFPVRWAVYLTLLFGLILFGKYNESPSFIYFQF